MQTMQSPAKFQDNRQCVCEQQARRAALLERETGLQRWAVKLELESARQAAAARSLLQQLQKVMHLLASWVLLYRCVHATRLSCSTGCCCQIFAATAAEGDAPSVSHSVCMLALYLLEDCSVKWLQLQPLLQL